jgi:hypothetical protein
MELAGEDQAMGPYSQDDPEAPLAIPDQKGQMQQVSPEALVAEGMMLAGNYMASNGPTQARHIGKARTMTKGQLEEQKMNEAAGYPSNLEEAEKVKELEGKVTNIEAGISQILSHLGGQSSPANPASNAPTGGNPASPVAVPTPTPVPSVTVPQPSPNSIEPDASTEPDDRQPRLRQVTLKDGRKISVPAVASQVTPMSLGPAAGVQEQPPTQLEEETFEDGGDDWGDPVAIVPEPDEPVPAAPAPDPNLVKVQTLVQEVNQFLQTNDVHRFWRRHISRNLHRHVGYNGWPRELQVEFNTRFKGFLQDPVFITQCCKKVISMELGHALGVKWVVSFLVATAGFTAFALCGLDG